MTPDRTDAQLQPMTAGELADLLAALPRALPVLYREAAPDTFYAVRAAITHLRMEDLPCQYANSEGDAVRVSGRVVVLTHLSQ